MTAPYRLRAARPAAVFSAGESLGPKQQSYRTGAVGHVIWAAAPFVLLLAYGVWLAHQGLLVRWFNSTFSELAVATLFVLSIALIAHTAAVGGAEVIRVHANGLLDLRTGQAARWDEIRSLTAVWDDQRARIQLHVLATTGGARMAFGVDIAEVNRLVDEVRVRLVDGKLASLQARLAEGGFVRFGPFVANAHNLAAEGRTLRWTDVGRIDAEGGQLVVRTRAGERWAAATLHDVPNAFLLAEIAEQNAHSERAGG